MLIPLLLVPLLLVCPCGLLIAVLRGVLLLLRVSGLLLLLRGVGSVLLALRVTTGHELNIINNNLDVGTFLPLVILPLVVAESARNGYFLTLAQDLCKPFSTFAKTNAVEEIGSVIPLASLVVLDALVDRDAEVEYARSTLSLFEVGFSGQISRKNTTVNHFYTS